MSDGMHVTDPAVLMVDDDKEVADAYALKLAGAADVTTAYGGRAALEAVEDGLVPDVVLLDRHMPGLSGDEVLSELRERQVRTRVVMVTAIDPDLDVLEMPFDDYLCKPVAREDVRTAVDHQCRVLAHELLGEYFELTSKRVVLQSDRSAADPGDDRYADLDRRANRLADRVRGLLPEADGVLSAFDAVDRGGR